MSDRRRRATGQGSKSPNRSGAKSPGRRATTGSTRRRSVRNTRSTERKGGLNGRSAKSPGRGGKKTGNMDTLSEKDKRKIEQELKKKYDAMKKMMMQERKKLDQTKREMESEMKKIDREKIGNDRLKNQIRKERDAWLRDKKRQRVANAPASMAKIKSKLKVWVQKESKTRQVQKNINKTQGEMKQQSSIMKDEQQHLKVDTEKFLEDTKEFKVKNEELNSQYNKGEGERTRLQELEKSLKLREQKTEDSNQEFDRLCKLLVERENLVVENGDKFDAERVEVDEMKSSLYSKLVEKRVSFVNELSDLSAEVYTWNCSFCTLFKGVGEQVGGETKDEVDDLGLHSEVQISYTDGYSPLDEDTEKKVTQEYITMEEQVVKIVT